MVDACTSVGALPFYGPYGDIRDEEGCETQFRASFLLGCVGAWSLHPAQIAIAKRVYSPDPEEVAFAKKVIEAIPDGRGVHMIDGKMQDDATWKQCKVMVNLAEMLARKDPELAEAYGFEPQPRRRLTRRCRLPRRMRFFEFEAREIVKRAGIPVTDYGFTTDPAEARQIAERIGGPTVIKSQVLTGGRMKAGGVKFADTPEEAESHARDILALEIGGHMPRGVLVDPKAEVEQEYYAGVVWDGTAQAAGDDLLAASAASTSSRSPRSSPTRSAAGHFSNILPFSDFQAKEVIASTGVTGSALNRLVPIVDPARAAVRRERHDRSPRSTRSAELAGRLVRRAGRAHGHRERGARPPQGAARRRSASARRRRAQAREATPFELAGEEVDAADHRGVAGQRHRVRRQPRPRDRRRRRLADALRRRPRPRRQARQLLRDRRQPVGRQGLRPGQAGARASPASTRSR